MNPVRDKNLGSSGPPSAGVSNGMKRIGVVGILILAFLGIADSAYLAEHEANGTPLICNVQNLSGCNIVASSQYSQVFGIPIAQFGVLFYSILFVLAALELVIFDRLLRRVLQGLALVGIIASIYFTFVQIFFIGAVCMYCIVSAFITLFIFVLASFIEPVRRDEENKLLPVISPPPAPAPSKGNIQMPPAP